MATVKAFESLRRGGPPGRPIRKRDAANADVISRVQASKGPGRGFELKRRGEAEYRKAATVEAYRKALAALRLQTGDAIYTRRAGARTVFVLRAVVVIERVKVPPIPDPNATAGVKAIWKALFECLAEVEDELGYELAFVYQGIYNCRRIDGSSSWSQHAFRNALDWHLVRRDLGGHGGTGAIDLRAMDLLVAKLRRRGVAAELLWRVTGHFGHAHGTGAPKRSGLPACA